MQKIHLEAFCKLLSLPFGKLVNTFGTLLTLVFLLPDVKFLPDRFGPLINSAGRITPFAPLLRARTMLLYGIVCASWTLYQPHALVWDYGFWGSRDEFGKQAGLLLSKLPNFQWERIIPAPFLQPWLSFISLLKTKKGSGNAIDVEVGRLLPLFNCSNYQIPCRILTEKEVTVLSGLDGHWTRTSTEDAYHLPEDLVRSMCGNSFHPDLVSSALVCNETLKTWIVMPQRNNPPLVANQATAYEVFSDLVNKVRTQANNMNGAGLGGRKIDIDPTLPVFETPRPIPGDFE